MKYLILPIVIFTFSWIAPAEESTRPPELEKAMQRLRTGYFPVVMRRSGGNVDLYREANTDSRICVEDPTPERVAMYAEEGMPIYVYVFDGDGVLHLKDFWKKDRQAFMDNRSIETLKRNPSLFDPAVRENLFKQMTMYAKGYRDTDVLAMSVAHESSNTGFSSPLDYDYSDFALTAFREWLKLRYENIGELNTAWQMDFESFGTVIPPITDEIIDREYPNYPNMNLAPWYDFREFMDDSFIDLIHELAAIIRKEAPGIPTSATVTAVPSAYGGWDYARLLQAGKIDVLETYPFPGDKGLIRGLTGGQTVNVCSLYVSQGAPMKLRAWRNFLNGERSNFFAGRGSQIFPHKDKLGGYSEEYQPEFERMRKYARLIGDAEPYDGGVRMIYSQPSVRCYWFIDNKPDGKTYPNRGSKWEINHNTYIQALAGWQDLLGNMGVHPLFESYLDLREGRFTHGLPETLIANRYCAVSDAELVFLKKYVETGGILIVDESFAMFDDHGNARKNDFIPLLDMERPTLKATFGAVDIPNSVDSEPVIKTIGKGSIVFFNSTVTRFNEMAPEMREDLILKMVQWLHMPTVPVMEGQSMALDIDTYLYDSNNETYFGICSTLPDDTRELLISITDGRFVDAISGEKLQSEDGGSFKIKLQKNIALFLKVVR